MYFLLLLFSYVLTYFFSIAWFRLLKKENISFSGARLYDIGIIFLLFLGGMFVVTEIPSHELANRIQHALVWGFVISQVLYLGFLRSREYMEKFELWNILFLGTLFFGIANELLESFLQIRYHIIFSWYLEDTWYDLWANTFWALVWASVWVILRQKK